MDTAGPSPAERLERIRRHRDFPACPADLFIVSYPKAGRTWLRFILARICHHEFGDVELASRFIAEDRIDVGGRMVQFTHGLAQRDEFDATDMKLMADHIAGFPFVFLHRDPRDIVVSYFHERTKRSLQHIYETPADINEFVRRGDIGLPRILAFEQIWAAKLSGRNCRARLWYEDLHRAPEAPIGRLCQLIFAVTPAASSLTSALADSRFSEMRRIEAENFYSREKGAKRLRPYDANDPNSFKVRKGRVGGFREELDRETQAFADALLSQNRPLLGGA